MARPQRNDVATKSLARAITKLSKKKPGNASDISFWARSRYGLKVSDVTIHKAFKGELDPTACTLEVLNVLRRFYAVDPDALGDAAAERLRIADQMFGPPPQDGGSVTGESESACTRWPQARSRLRVVVDERTATSQAA